MATTTGETPLVILPNPSTEDVDDVEDPSSSDHESEITEYNFAADGDVILIVGSEEKVNIRIDSLIFRRASPPFAAMFSRRYAEGQALASSNNLPVEIRLPDDDTMAMMQMAAILQHCPHELPYLFDDNDVIDLAILADKYDCVDVIAPSIVGRWQSPETWSAKDRKTIQARIYCLQNITSMAAAYLFGACSHFSVFSNNVVCVNNTDSIFDLIRCSELGRLLPDSTCYLLLNAKTDLQLWYALRNPVGTKSKRFYANSFKTLSFMHLKPADEYIPPSLKYGLTLVPASEATKKGIAWVPPMLFPADEL